MLIKKGDEFGCYESEVTGTFALDARVSCHCTKCLEQYAHKASYLRYLRSETKRKGFSSDCKRCAVPANPKNAKWCTMCGNTPSRRPQDRLCLCGKEFERELIEIVRGNMGCALGQVEA